MYKTQIAAISKPHNPFNEQELEILQMLAYEYNIEEICHESELANIEVQKTLWRMYQKLEVNTRVGLIRAAFEHRILVLG